MQQRPNLVVGLGLAPGGHRNGLGTGTRAALEAARAAARRCRGGGVHVTLVHATGREGGAWPPRPDADGGHSVHDADPALLLDAEAALAELRAAGATAELVVTAGAAVPAIARRALFQRADLVLLGRTEGAEGLAGLGPTAAALVRTSPVPVWIVDPRHAHAEDGFVASARDRAGLALAAELARALRAPLHVTAASTVPVASAPVCGERARREHFDAARRRLAAEAVAALRAATERAVEPEVHVGFDEPRAFLHATAARLKASAVVLDPGAAARPSGWALHVGEVPTSAVVARGASFVSPYATSALYECN